MQNDAFTATTMMAVLIACSALAIFVSGGCAGTPDATGASSLPELEEAQSEQTSASGGTSTPVAATASPPYDVVRVPATPHAIGRLGVSIGRSWDYIVIHHSGTSEGSEAAFDRHHREKRGWLGVGYHFVIGNGRGSPDGAIEVTFRWEKQIHGAHAGVDKYNQHGIGICLVGNFDQSYPSHKQMASLAALVNYLQRRCSIPTSHILMHRQVKATSCPGKNFPYYQFISLLNH